jgi:transposase
MFYLGIDQHARQLTVSLRNEAGDVLLARRVSTEPDRIHAFFGRLTREWLRDGQSFVAVLEVCGFNDWLIRMLRDYRCDRVILIQPDDRKKPKTDRRDAAALSEMLWANRDRLLSGKPARCRVFGKMARTTPSQAWLLANRVGAVGPTCRTTWS